MIRKIEKKSLEIWYQVLGMVQTNCYLVVDRAGRDAVLIDPADEGPAIEVMQKEANAQIKGILLTHGHFDHMTAAREAAESFRTQIYASEAERELLADERMNCSYMGAKRLTLEADVWLKDGEVLTFGAISVKAISTPGHTKGGMCYYFEGCDVLISGDTLFFETVGRTDLPTGNSSAIIESVNKKLMVLPEDTLVLPGHGSQTTIGYEKRNNPYLNDNIWE